MTALLRLPEVMKRTGLARSTIYRDVGAGTFPAPVPIGAGSVAWVESEIEGWAQARIRAARPQSSASEAAAAS